MTMQRHLSRQGKDYLGGGLMLATGLAVATRSVGYDVGTLQTMGPGFFPMLLGVALALVGAAIMLVAWARADRVRRPLPGAEWRGWLCIALSIIAFIGLGRYGGLLPATFAAVFVAALGDRRNTLAQAGLLAGAATAIGVVVFWWGLKLQIPLLGWGQ